MAFENKDSNQKTSGVESSKNVQNSVENVNNSIYINKKAVENSVSTQKFSKNAEGVFLDTDSQEQIQGENTLSHNTDRQSAEFQENEYIENQNGEIPPCDDEEDSDDGRLAKTMKRIVLSFAAIILVVVVAVLAVGYSFLSKMGYASVDSLRYVLDEKKELELDSQVALLEPEDSAKIYELGGITDLSNHLLRWANNGGELMSDRSVINVLLIGLDQNDNGSTGRSDVMMLASLDRTNKKIALTSFYRDSYTYIGIGTTNKFTKLNAAYVYGGVAALVDTVEKDYKIKIDYYVSIEFDSFKQVIDAIGGVTVPVSEREAHYIYLSGVKIPSGENVLLNGEQALAFARLRASDSDIGRTGRQRLLISALMAKCRNIGLSEAAEVLDTVLPYIKTDIKYSELMSLAVRGLMEGWYAFPLQQLQMPSESCRMPYSGAVWLWIVDYPAAASELQRAIYGRTNIVLSPDRISPFDLVE